MTLEFKLIRGNVDIPYGAATFFIEAYVAYKGSFSQEYLFFFISTFDKFDLNKLDNSVREKGQRMRAKNPLLAIYSSACTRDYDNITSLPGDLYQAKCIGIINQNSHLSFLERELRKSAFEYIHDYTSFIKDFNEFPER